MKIAGNTTQLEIYDYPGEYAQRFDGVDPGGGDRPDDLKNIDKDSTRTTAIRMQEETTHAIVITGSSNCTLFAPPERNFTRTDQDKAKEQTLKNDGEYLLIGVTHYACGSDYRSSNTKTFTYYNTFACVPSTATSRAPACTRPSQSFRGPKTVTIVGPSGSLSIFTD